jgi:hypothetical protein
MHLTLCALVALSVSGVVAAEEVATNEVATVEVDEDEWNRSRETGHQLTLGFVNEGVDEEFVSLSYQGESNGNNSETVLVALMDGMEYYEHTYFGHNFILRKGDFTVGVRVEENVKKAFLQSRSGNLTQGPGSGFPYSIIFDNLAEIDEVASFRINRDDKDVVAGESTHHFTRANWKHTIYGTSQTPIASIEIYQKLHDEL